MADPADIDEPLTLEEACRIVFRGKIKPATLRAERDRGNLAVERIGRRDFVTIRDIREMRKRCRARGEARGSGSGRSEGTKQENAPTGPCGSSSAEQDSASRAAVKAIARALKQPSRNTSPSDTAPTPANVIHLASR